MCSSRLRQSDYLGSTNGPYPYVALRTDNALVYVSELYREIAQSYGLREEFILPHPPEQNGVAESFMGTLKLECIWQHRFDTYDQAKAAITRWVKHYNEMRPHSRLGYVPPAAWRASQTVASVESPIGGTYAAMGKR